MLIWIILGVIALVVLFIFVGMYNHLVQLKKRIKNAWAQIDVQTKKRYDLVPNLVEVVKGYATHERKVFTDVTKARAAISKAGSVTGKAKAENMLTGALKSLFAVSENYPKLQASANFMQLQEELSGIESKIAYARQFYNDTVLSYNTKIALIPWNFIASILAYKEEKYFEIEEVARKAVKVKF